MSSRTKFKQSVNPVYKVFKYIKSKLGINRYDDMPVYL